jgi:hypothetical protein
MGKEQIILTEPIKEKLRNLRDYMPGQDETTYQFGAYLAERLNPEIVPQGFYLAAQLALYDLENGVDGFTRQPIRNELAGLPLLMYIILQGKIVSIAEAVTPADFASDVRKMSKEVEKKVSKPARE